MDLIKENKLRYLAGKTGFNIIFLEKDYMLTVLLYLIKDIKGLYFKGGTALNKIFLKHARLSEDLDFSADENISELKKQIENIVKENGNVFTKIKTENETSDFVRYKIFYKSYFENTSYIILDINKKASVLLNSEKYKVPNFYGLKFEIAALNIKEIIAEKMRAIITRNKPRDYFDLYFILKKYDIDISLVKKKVAEANEIFDVERIFKNANKIYSKWDSDISKLTNKKLEFLTCIKFLKKRVNM
ncbi:MAG: nucleotidyl transferase AbiEii/AbiGii toxin family protein [Nanoarchaeota archaeon]|nr:nucleotidyl transferase AbiEii/AbiGii toxin family protein [Nanoarchaeota archaeon]